uniref:NADH-ubiquinone oxidoreductase chain 3 n=1 Tax=Leptocentrus longispinus TaxID=3065210 RepID=A0AA95SSL4_9HEMI|nr:NADH dehydrogenase subunit 3 [Leptocentrus longispinus]WKZ08077.1 NADH dehydrogenase subunit 3 [Leptocentrus longispinus]
MIMMKSLIMIMTLMLIMTLMMMMMSKKSILENQKMSPFECGFNPLSSKRVPFSIHFFTTAIIFLIFDVEIVIILPMIMTMKMSMIKFWMATFMVFIAILLMGLYYEWFNGLLEWTN